MDNVIAFPGRIDGNKNVKDHEFTDWLEKQNFPEAIHDIVNRLPHSFYFNNLPKQWWDVTNWGKYHNSETGNDAFVLTSSLRRQLVPEFGTQSYVGFTWITYGWDDEEPDHDAMPNNLMGVLHDYINSYPETICPNKLFCMALLSEMLSQRNISYVDTERTDDELFISFYEKTPVEGRWLRLTFGCDFLPIILDDAAIALQAMLDK